MTKKEFVSNMGSNIQNERLKNGLKIEEMSKLMGISISFLTLIERGKRGTTAYNLYRLANLLDIDINKFFISPKENAESSESDNAKKKKIKKIIILLNQLSENELTFFMKMIESIDMLKIDMLKELKE